MRTGKRFFHGLVIVISVCICLTSALAIPTDSQSAAYSILHDFAGGATDGFQPYYGGPALSGSTLYGMTQGGPTLPGVYAYNGTIYKINTDGSEYGILHNFDNSEPIGDGTSPRGGLTLSGSTLYGCTPYGGRPYIQTGGTVFKIGTSGGSYQVLYTFPPDSQCHPYAAPVVSGGTLYGTTSSESTDLKGEIFAMSTAGGPPQVLHVFGSITNDGTHPYGSLTLVGSRLYGMTPTGGQYGIDGGAPGYGVIFAVDTDGGNYQVLHNFAGFPTDGRNPYGALTLVGSKLYGMTSADGPDGGGVIFSIDLTGGGYRVILNFGTVTGGTTGGPFGSLTLSGLKLYGLTSAGAPGGGSGVIFRVNPDGTGFQILHKFNPDLGDGGMPLGDVTFAGSRLYGWTYGNGAHNAGVFFSFQPPQVDTGMLQLLLLQ
jgi:uncharacterized repeat protein (TIGR03803 family)